ncbi:MAG: formyltransferase family protein [Brevinema sp.]
MMIITILTDKKSWFNKYNIILQENLIAQGHTVQIIYNKQDLPCGDVAFFLSYFEIVGPKYLARNKNNIVIHQSDLPKGKGWSPASWLILEGATTIPLTLFEAVVKCDAGDIYFKDYIHLNGSELIKEWQDLLAKKMIDMALEFIINYNTYIQKPQKQTGDDSFYSRRSPSDSELDINKTIDEQFNLMRIADNDMYPLYFIKNNQKYILHISKETQND